MALFHRGGVPISPEIRPRAKCTISHIFTQFTPSCTNLHRMHTTQIHKTPTPPKRPSVPKRPDRLCYAEGHDGTRWTPPKCTQTQTGRAARCVCARVCTCVAQVGTRIHTLINSSFGTRWTPNSGRAETGRQFGTPIRDALTGRAGTSIRDALQ
jgi:hypothetical protein